MEASTPSDLLAKAGEWREWSTEAVEATTDKEESTGLGDDAETLARREVEFYRGKARLAITKHRDWKDAEIEAFKARYFINKDTFASRPIAEQALADIQKHATEDALPGVIPARLAASAATFTRYTTGTEPQTDAQTKATAARQKTRHRLRRSPLPPPRNPIRRRHPLALARRTNPSPPQ